MKIKKRLVWLLGTVLMGLFILIPGINVRADGDDDETYTVTFNYGMLETVMSGNNYTYGDKTYTHTVKVKAGEYLSTDDLTLPEYGDELGGQTEKMNFNRWLDEDGYPRSVSYLYVDEDITLYAYYDHTITYHAGEEGHFYNGDTIYENVRGEYDTTIDNSVCCYPNRNSRAFVGWALKEDATEDDLINNYGNFSVYQNIDLYAVYVDGYPVTFNVNCEDGLFSYYSESYIDMDGYTNWGKTRDLDKKTFTLTYPIGKKPSEANYFCYDPLNNTNAILPGTADMIFEGWSYDSAGTQKCDFYSLTPGREGVTIYVNWSEYWTVTYDSNTTDNSYTRSEKVAKGSSVNDINYSYFTYETGDASRRCIAFNTKPDGSGVNVDYSFVPEGNITVYAQYKDAFTIRLDGNGGSIYNYGSSSFTIDQGEAIGHDYKDAIVLWYPEEGEKYSRKVVKEFNTKADGSGLEVTASFTPTKNETLYAIPEEGWLVTFETGAKDGDEGNQFGTIFCFRRDYNVTSATYAYSKTRPMNDVPDLRYYVNDETKEFAGWTTEYGNLSKLIDPYTFVPDKDMTLYPAWYDLALIRLNANGGKFRYSYSDDNEGLQKVYVRKGKKFSPYGDYEEPTMDGGVFVGWSETANGSPVAYGKTYTPNSSMNFYAVWEQGYTITLDANLGTQSGSIHYISPSGQEYHGDPTKAVFTIRKGDSVLVDSENSSEQVGGWREDDYILAGFSKTKDGEKVDLKKYIPEKDETFYAIWEAPCVVTFDPNGGKLPNYYKKLYAEKGGTIYDLPEPEKPSEDKYFAGWFTDLDTASEKAFNTNTIVNDDITVKAKWVDETVTVSFTTGEGAGIYDYSAGEYVQTLELKVAKGYEVDLLDYRPFIPGETTKEFVGWQSGSYIWYKSYADRFYKVDADIAFTAIWKDKEYYTVTFDGNGGKVDVVSSEGDGADILEQEVLTGYPIGENVYAYMKNDSNMEFTGWYLEKECKNLVATAAQISRYEPSGNITLYAGFKQNRVPVTGIALDKETLTLGIADGKKDTYILSAIVYPFNATYDKIIFTSSNPEVATVSENGEVVPVKAGDNTAPATAIITAKVVDGKNEYTATCEVKVVGVTNSDIKLSIDGLLNDVNAAASPADAENKVKQALANMGGADKLAEAVEGDSEIAQKLEELEEAYTGKANVTVKNPDNQANQQAVAAAFGMDVAEVQGAVSVTGAGLNAKANETIELSVKKVAKGQEKDVDEKYDDKGQLDIDLVKGDGSEVKDLAASVTFSLPIPKGTIRSKLYILHFNPDGSFEFVRPVFKNNKMYTTVSHFSRFAIVELADGSSGNDPSPAPTATPTPTKAPAAPTATPTKDTTAPTKEPSAPVSPSVSPSAVPSAGPKEGETVSETGSTATYKVTSAADKTVAYTGDPKASGKVTIKSTIKIGDVTYTVTAIDNNAFKKKKITAVTIPATVESIGKSAFEGCSKLKTVTIKGTKLKTIGDNAFKGCKVLSKITIPKSVTKVGKQAFSGCTKLKTITVKSKKTKFLKNSFKKVPKSAKMKLPKMTSKEKKAFKKMMKTAGYKGKYK